MAAVRHLGIVLPPYETTHEVSVAGRSCLSNFMSILYTDLKTQRHLEDRELNQARSKPDTVDRPVRTAHTFVHHYNSTQYCNIETVFFQYSPSSRPTSHLRCGQVEVTGGTSWRDNMRNNELLDKVDRDIKIVA